MNYKLTIIIIIVIIIISILLLKEDFITSEIDFDSQAFNNLITNINDKNINIDNITTTSTLTTTGKLEANELGETLKGEIMKEVYPIGSLFLSRKYYNENNKEELKGTPLYYGKWKLINYKGVIGTITKDYKFSNDEQMLGYQKIQIQHIPPHKHKYSSPNERKSMYNSNDNYSTRPYLDKFTESTIYDNNNQVVYQENYVPYGYYVFTYRKTEL